MMNFKKLFLSAAALLLLFSTFNAKAQDMVSAVVEEGLEKVISYDVSKFMDIRDRKLSDVLVKMPGIVINSFFGMITVNNVMVAKFYVNGIDMGGDDFSPILDLKVEDVERVEITSNFVEEKIMQGRSYSSDASMNVVLKAEAGGHWSGSVKGGLGASPLLYNGEASALNIGKKAQTNIILKADNTGLDYSGNVFTPLYMGFLVGQQIFAYPSLAPLSSQRVRTNNSALGSINSAIHLKDDLQMNLSLTLHSDKLSAESFSETSYYLGEKGGDMAKYERGENAQTKQKDVVATVSFLSNTEKKFLKDVFCVHTNWSGADMGITGTFPSTQNITSNEISARNILNWRLPVGKNILSIDWTTASESRPQGLGVSRDIGILSQDISSRALDSDLSISYNINMGKFTFSLTGGSEAKSWKYITKMTPIPEVNSEDNDSRYSFINGSATPKLTYISDRLQIQLNAPLYYYHHTFNDFRTGQITKTGNWHFSPSLNIKYEATKNLSLSGMAYIADNGVDGTRIYSGMILTDYQNLSRGFVDFVGTITKCLYSDFTFRHPKTSIFINGAVSRTWNNVAQMGFSTFTPNFIINGQTPDPNKTRTITDYVSLSASKGIDAFKGSIGINGNYTHNESTITRNLNNLPYINNVLVAGVSVNGKLLSWMNVIYNLSTTYSTLKIIEDEGLASTTLSLTQNLELIFSPWERFNFSFFADHYRNQLTEEEYKNLVMLDFKAEFRINDKWQLHASVTNLLNQDTYDYKLINSFDASSSYSSYKIRPRNLLLSLYFKF